jgi:acetylserotonin N-methyltransferase
MPKGGLIVIHDAFLNSEKTGPLPVAEYSCLLAHSTQGRCYSHREMSVFLEAAGFQSPRFSETACDRGVVIAEKG